MASGFNSMGQFVPPSRRAVAYNTVRRIGLSGEDGWRLVEGMADKLGRDQPHEAIQWAKDAGIDLTGAYRLVAELLTRSES